MDRIREYVEQTRAKLVIELCSPMPDEQYARLKGMHDLCVDILALDEVRRPAPSDRFYVILDAAQDAVGVELTAERTQENTDIRMLVAKQMRDEGYSNTVIGLLLHRDHSTVSYLNKCVNEMLEMPGAFSKFMRTYNRFKEYLGQ